jgi:hypothetical protein
MLDKENVEGGGGIDEDDLHIPTTIDPYVPIKIVFFIW